MDDFEEKKDFNYSIFTIAFLAIAIVFTFITYFFASKGNISISCGSNGNSCTNNDTGKTFIGTCKEVSDDINGPCANQNSIQNNLKLIIILIIIDLLLSYLLGSLLPNYLHNIFYILSYFIILIFGGFISLLFILMLAFNKKS